MENGYEVQIAVVESDSYSIGVHAFIMWLKLVSKQGLEMLCIVSASTWGELQDAQCKKMARDEEGFYSQLDWTW